MSAEMDDLYAQIRVATAKTKAASDVFTDDAYWTGTVTDRSKPVREFLACYAELKALKQQAVDLEEALRG